MDGGEVARDCAGGVERGGGIDKGGGEERGGYNDGCEVTVEADGTGEKVDKMGAGAGGGGCRDNSSSSSSSCARNSG